jgi:uncharacterized protein YuzB (UPF0349 family)
MELYSQSVYDTLKERYPNEKIEVVDCAGEHICGLCADVPFVLRNNAVVAGRTARDLYYKLERGMGFLDDLEAAKEDKTAAVKQDEV